MSSLRILTVAGVLGLGLVVAGCGGGSGSGPDPYDGPLTVPSGGNVPPLGQGTPSSGTVLDQQRTIWVSQGIRDYRYTLTRTIYGPPLFTDPVMVEVRGGRIVSQTYQQSGNPIDPQYAYWWPSIDGLFDLVQEGYDSNADQVDVTYDPALGYPTWASIDYSLGLADDEHSFFAGDLTLLP